MPSARCGGPSSEYERGNLTADEYERIQRKAKRKLKKKKKKTKK